MCLNPLYSCDGRTFEVRAVGTDILIQIMCLAKRTNNNPSEDAEVFANAYELVLSASEPRRESW
jgi:hypothetical protein